MGCLSSSSLVLFLFSVLWSSVVVLVDLSGRTLAHGRPLVPAMYVFGDSLVDVGNNNHILLSVLKANFPHNGVDYPGCKATGRFSNGKNAADFLAEILGLPAFPPYLSVRHGDGDAFLQGVNFASGGAGFLNTTNRGQCISMDDQIRYYSDDVYGKVAEERGTAGAHDHFSKSIFTVVAGSNDFLGYLRSTHGLSRRQFVSSMLSKLREQIRRIYSRGGRKFVVVGTPPVGCTPSLRRHSRTKGCLTEANQLSAEFIKGASSALRKMASELGDMRYCFFDANRVVLEFIERPSDYGFVEVKAACCGLGGDLKANIPCLPISTYCSNREDHLFWDSYHPTEAASRKAVDVIFGGSKSLVFPLNLRELAAL